MTIKAGVIMVSPDTQKLLVVVNRANMKPTNLKFGLPKGHIEGKEPVAHCAMRELQEETGLLSRVFKSDKRVVVSETTYYLVKAHKCLNPTPQDNTEIGDSRWVTWDEMMSTDCNRGLRLIRDKIKNPKSSLMDNLKALKPRKIGLCNMKPRIKQEPTYEKDMGHIKTSGNKATAEGWDDDEETELP
jgi:ADP-ribose pyrophosphatase YjhB (NUDIX family)